MGEYRWGNTSRGASVTYSKDPTPPFLTPPHPAWPPAANGQAPRASRRNNHHFRSKKSLRFSVARCHAAARNAPLEPARSGPSLRRRQPVAGGESTAQAAAPVLRWGTRAPNYAHSTYFCVISGFNLRQRAGGCGTVRVPDAQGSSIASSGTRRTPSARVQSPLLFSYKDEFGLSAKTVIMNNPKLT